MNTRHIEVSIDRQTLRVSEGEKTIRTFLISSGAKGVGFVEGSYRTPTGNFRVFSKIGDSEPLRTVFKAREPVGLYDAGCDNEKDYILTRVIQLEGLDVENSNTLERCIYIHGTNREDLIGQPASHGCLRLANRDMVELFDMIAVGDTLHISTPTQTTDSKMLFIDCDSTLSSIEGIDELARFKGEDVFDRCVALTHAAMNGDLPLSEVFARRLEIIQPDHIACDAVAQLYCDTLVPGVENFLKQARLKGWTPVIISGGFARLIEPLAKQLNIEYVEAVPLFLDENGQYAGFDSNYPTARNLGKNEIIREWKSAMLPQKTIMIGDGVSDLETTPDVDLFIGFGGVVARAKVKDSAAYWTMDFDSILARLN